MFDFQGAMRENYELSQWIEEVTRFRHMNAVTVLTKTLKIGDGWHVIFILNGYVPECEKVIGEHKIRDFTVHAQIIFDPDAALGLTPEQRAEYAKKGIKFVT